MLLCWSLWLSKEIEEWVCYNDGDVRSNALQHHGSSFSQQRQHFRLFSKMALNKSNISRFLYFGPIFSILNYWQIPISLIHRNNNLVSTNVCLSLSPMATTIILTWLERVVMAVQFLRKAKKETSRKTMDQLLIGWRSQPLGQWISGCFQILSRTVAQNAASLATVAWATESVGQDGVMYEKCQLIESCRLNDTRNDVHYSNYNFEIAL